MHRAERQLGLLWGGAALALIAASPFAARLAAAMPLCLFKSLTGIPCLSCGAGRAALALARLDLAEALAWNPLAALAWMALVVGGLAAGVTALANRPLPGWPRDLPRRAKLGVLAVALADWLYLVERGV
jgi:hypothetical protein